MGRFDRIPEGAPGTTTSATDFWVHEGVVHGRAKTEVRHAELAHVIEDAEQLRRLTGGEPFPLFFDARHLDSFHIDTRAYIRHHFGELFTRAAMIVEPHMLGSLSHALLGVGGASIPFRVFTDEDEAWRFAIGT